MDILAALQATNRERTNLRCKVARWLDSIPPDTPGRDELAATFEERDPHSQHYRSQADLTALAAVLGNPISQKVVGDHLRHQCRCYGYSA